MVNDIIQSVVDAKSTGDLMVCLDRTRNLFGFDYYAFGVRAHLPVTAPTLSIISNYPADWQSAYQKNRYDLVDPIVPSALSSPAPIVWSRELFPVAGSFWEEAGSFGATYGCSQSVESKGFSGLLTFSRSAESMTRPESAGLQADMVVIAHYVHTKYAQFLAPIHFPETLAKLTERETDVLKWSADGKTSYEISILMGISERTVNFHLSNIFEKLNVTNKVAACVKAVNYRLI